MRKLVLCVDRDDDIGVKTDVDTPLIGREDILDAAMELGLSDPEDSDTNSLLSAVSTYDDLREKGEDVEVATVCGSQSIGYESDEILSKEVDEVLDIVKPDTVVLVTDGAEDEYITPIITSKIDISHVKTVHVKQSESVENLYYMIVKGFQEERTKKRVLFPFSLALLVYGILRMIALFSNLAIEGLSALSGLPGFGIGVISFVLGGYLIARIYEIDKKLLDTYTNLREAVSSASVWLPFTIVAILLVLMSGWQGWQAILALDGSPLPKIILTFVSTVIWWWIGAIFLHELGHVIHLYITEGKVKRSFWALILSLIVLTVIFYGSFEYIRVITGQQQGDVLPLVIVIISAGLGLSVLGGVTQMKVSKNEDSESEEEEKEEDQE